MKKQVSTADKLALELQPSDETEITCYERIARILICLSNGLSSVTEIARECNMKVPTVHRLLKSLTKPRFTTYDAANHRYFLGPLIVQVASNASTNHQYLRMCSLKEIKGLSDNYGETISLTVLIGTEFTQITKITSKHELIVQGLGEVFLVNSAVLPFGATQKVLLSQLVDTDLRLMLHSISQQDQRPLNIEAMVTEIMNIREQGFAVSSGERIPGATCLSCPVYNYYFPSALSIIGPRTRLSKKTASLLKALKESAAK
ncbi:MAG TPA: IclR family transcriptional regulator C-terminal domain-containing protein, partial [Dehalococcoidales bacterium]|nr:IclR family transcriptional regulator C-terminal domain-containing protein [Dehalococcoidales bacterium]